MPDLYSLTALIIGLALVFDFINGFHDASNATATLIATRVLKYWQAVCWSAFFNFVALFFVSAGVAKTVGSGLIDLSHVTSGVIIAGLIAGIGWNLLTWWWAIPASSSHTLLGAYAGAVFTHVVMDEQASIYDAYIASGWIKVFAFIFIAPLVGYIASYIIVRIANHFARGRKGSVKFFKRAQLLSSALLSFNHGGNDAQKTAGIIAGALVVGGYLDGNNFDIPEWVLLASYSFIALGTMAGGWRITKTLGYKLADLKPAGGFSAETGSAVSIAIATYLHMPISTTLATTGAVVGVGVAHGEKPVHWSLFRKIMGIWCLTIPVAFVMGAAVMLIVRVFA